MEKLKEIMKIKKVWVSLTLVLALLVIALGWGGFYYSKYQVINRYVAAYSKPGKTFENIKGYVVWSDTEKQITTEEAQYTKFNRLSNSSAQKLTKQLRSANASDSFYLKNIGHTFLIFPKYRIAMKPLRLTIKTNVKKTDILLNEKEVATSNSDNYSVTLDRLPISDYTASLSGTYKNKPLKMSRTYDGSNTTLDLTVSFKNFTVTSNLTDGDLYFDDTRVGTLSDGKYQVTDYPLTDSAKAYVKKNYADGELRSQKRSISEISDGDTVALDSENMLDNTAAGKILVSSFNQVMSYLNTGQDSPDISSVFENGNNNDFYKGLKESIKAKMQTDTRKASSLTIPNITLTSLSQVGKESYVLGFSATYDFYYDKSTDTTKSTHGDVIQNLTGEVTVKKSGSSYIIANSGQKSITVASEDNKVASDAIFPDGLLGTWVVKKDNYTLTMIFSKDGTITKKIDYKDDATKDTTNTAKVTALEEKSSGLYHYVYADGTDTSTFIGLGGIGGVGIKYTYGIKVNGSTITLVIWQASTNAEFDYNNPSSGEVLTKQ